MSKINTFYFVPKESSMLNDNDVMIFVNRNNLIDITIPALEKYMNPLEHKVTEAHNARIKWPFTKIDGDLKTDDFNYLLTLPIFEVKLNENFGIIDIDCINDKSDIISTMREYMNRENNMKRLEIKKSVK